MSVIHGANYGTPTLDLNFAKNKSLIDTVSGRNFVTFTRSQANYKTTYVGSDGLIKYASADEPRFDHNPLTGECLGLLIEEARTNYQKFSNTFNSAGLSGGDSKWQDFGEVNSQNNLYPDPFGTSTATRIIPTTNSSSHFIGRYHNYNTGVYAHSIFLKPAGYRRLEINVNSSKFTVDLSGSGSFANNNSTTYATKIQPFENGWYRLEWVWNNGGGGGANTYQPRITILDNSGNSTFAGDGVSGIDLFGYQQEVGSFCTSYIPTDGSTKTRSADSASITGTNFSRWYNSSENTVFCQGISASRENSGYYALQGSGSNGSSVLVYPANTITWQVFDTSFQVNTTLSTYNSVSSIKSAVAMKSNDFVGVINGGSIVTDNSGTVPSVTSLVIGNYLGGGASYDYTGTINRLTYYPTRLQDYQLQQLTK